MGQKVKETNKQNAKTFSKLKPTIICSVSLYSMKSVYSWLGAALHLLCGPEAGYVYFNYYEAGCRDFFDLNMFYSKEMDRAWLKCHRMFKEKREAVATTEIQDESKLLLLRQANGKWGLTSIHDILPLYHSALLLDPLTKNTL